MNEFRDYDKAAAAMQNAVKFMHDRQKKDGKMGWTKLPKKQDELASLKTFEEKLHHVSEFVKVQVYLVASVIVRNAVSCVCRCWVHASYRRCAGVMIESARPY